MPKRVYSASFVIVVDVTRDVLQSHLVVAKSLVVLVAAADTLSLLVASKPWVAAADVLVVADSQLLHLAVAKSLTLADAAHQRRSVACWPSCSASVAEAAVAVQVHVSQLVASKFQAAAADVLVAVLADAADTQSLLVALKPWVAAADVLADAVLLHQAVAAKLLHHHAVADRLQRSVAC